MRGRGWVWNDDGYWTVTPEGIEALNGI
jgi:hypothetical protein